VNEYLLACSLYLCHTVTVQLELCILIPGDTLISIHYLMEEGRRQEPSTSFLPLGAAEVEKGFGFPFRLRKRGKTETILIDIIYTRVCVYFGKEISK